jgi:hypothetical protein
MAPKRKPDVWVTSDRAWVWTKRGLTAAAFIGTTIWYVFQFYSQVQALGQKVDALWQGQTTIMNQIADVKNQINALPKKK